ncbi:hypothetical protein IQ249_03055 [Lusitaniella coriacea LEGE 07157]|uniref:NB-ARC domain-containing protein n=1 Tax=Lusitaniella coriacea LEGE 07157 TaxID=945747 RepID=A0A8J7B8N4_9CYAN|nr:NB-ARC domain-containing protein [Lusitaniella coriacea]MBE9114868.1 hypothetical protein [Lusitaniella coriacea LEGE 07157]
MSGDTLIASKEGLDNIKQARESKGWTVEDDRWLKEASKILNPAWQKEQNDQEVEYEKGISGGTWRRFLYRTNPINAKAFKAYCKVLALDWRKVVYNENAHNQVIIQENIEQVLRERANISKEKLFGIEKYLTQLQGYLQDAEGSWLISIVGVGGVGKTSIAEKLVREYAVNAGFYKIAWVTAKTTCFQIASSSQISYGSRLNVDSLIYDIAEQLEVNLPSTIKDHFFTLKSVLNTDRYLIVIDNLETLEDHASVLKKFNPYSQVDNLRPSKIIFTSRTKIQKLTTEVRELEINGISLLATLELIRYKGSHIKRIREASDSDLNPIFNVSNGIPLTVLLLINLIALDDSPLHEIFQALYQQKELYDFLYAEFLSSISENAWLVLRAMTALDSNTPLERHLLQETAGLDDQEFKSAIRECLEYSLLQSINSLTGEPRYLIHNLLYEFIRNFEI